MLFYVIFVIFYVFILFAGFLHCSFSLAYAHILHPPHQGSFSDALFWTIDLRAAIQTLGEITGDEVSEAVQGPVWHNHTVGLQGRIGMPNRSVGFPRRWGICVARRLATVSSLSIGVGVGGENIGPVHS